MEFNKYSNFGLDRQMPVASDLFGDVLKSLLKRNFRGKGVTESEGVKA